MTCAILTTLRCTPKVAYGGVLKLIGRDDMAAVALAGASCGIAYSCVVCPFELIKVGEVTPLRPPVLRTAA